MDQTKHIPYFGYNFEWLNKLLTKILALVVTDIENNDVIKPVPKPSSAGSDVVMATAKTDTKVDDIASSALAGLSIDPSNSSSTAPPASDVVLYKDDGKKIVTFTNEMIQKVFNEIETSMIEHKVRIMQSSKKLYDSVPPGTVEAGDDIAEYSHMLRYAMNLDINIRKTSILCPVSNNHSRVVVAS